LSVEEIRGKFNALAGEVLDAARTDRLWGLCMDIDLEPDLTALYDLIAAPR
jgi:uncharacterized protein YfkK (UPF0435 family)